VKTQHLRCRRICILAGVLVTALATRAIAQTAAPTAEQVKAAYLHKFAGYVEWPQKAFADPSKPFVVAVVGADDVYSELARLVVGRTVQGRPVEVRHLERTDLAADVHVLYIGKDVGAEAAAGIVAAYRGKPVLAVTDVPRGVDVGGALNFVQTEKRVRFDAAPAVAEQNGLHLSSRLLAVAERVGGAPP